MTPVNLGEVVGIFIAIIMLPGLGMYLSGIRIGKLDERDRWRTWCDQNKYKRLI